MDIKIYGHKHSRAFRVLWMLEELGMDYVSYPTQPHTEELLKLSPFGKIPVAVVESEVITDSTAILTYLAESQSTFTFQAGTFARAKQDSLTFMLLDELETCVWNAAKHSFVLPSDKRVSSLKPTLKWEFSQSLEKIVAHMNLENFLLGEIMTIPDFILTHCLDWAKVAKFEEFPEPLSKYHSQMVQRPAYQRVANS
ncbi:MAG: glutathione S-transferase [Rhodobacteraceae bacterium]|nr:glutathione S-transferase [Paracoccaceae bacterium]MCY4249596.1 glutathione S-transferase [Paracoccaceae bacterium]